MSDDVQPGVRIDGDVWQEFREDVKNRRGTVRGHLKTELENAIREYLRDDASPTEQRIENRLSRIEQAVGAAATDGGVDTCDPEPHTHAPGNVTVEEKPPANAATEKKVAYLVSCLIEEAGADGEITSVARSVIRDVVKEEYGFRSDTAKRYVETLIDRLGLEESPYTENVLVSPERREELEEEYREGVRKEAEGEWEDYA